MTAPARRVRAEPRAAPPSKRDGRDAAVFYPTCGAESAETTVDSVAVRDDSLRAMNRSAALLLLLTACGSSSSAPSTSSEGTTTTGSLDAGAGGGGATGSGGSGGSTGAGGGGGSADAGADASPADSGGDGGEPLATGCAAPIALAVPGADATVVGDGTPASCTFAALGAALAKGGFIAFSCGAAPITVAVPTTLELPTDRDTVLDGGGLVTLDGGGTTRILAWNHPDYRKNTHVLTLQRLTLQHGRSAGKELVPAHPAPCSSGFVDGAGGAIYMRDGNLRVFECTFLDNHAEELGPDVGGGAIYVAGSQKTTVFRSTFKGNGASNGGAVGMLNSDLEVVDSAFEGNTATGHGANSVDAAKCPFENNQVGSGGNGGAIAIDGGSDGPALFCGVTFVGNHGGIEALGGALFRTPDLAKQTTTLDRCLFDGNQADGAGGAYFHNSTLIVRDTTFSNQTANGFGALQSDGSTFDFVNVTFSGNVSHKAPGATVAAFGVDGRLLNCTFADGTCEGGDMFGAAIFGSPTLTIDSSLFVNNTGQNPGAPMQCVVGAGTTGTGNLQFPKQNLKGNDDAPCAPAITFADPDLGGLGHHGGPVPTRLVSAGSPALGAGQVCAATDARGKPRPATGCTAGATEGSP